MYSLVIFSDNPQNLPTPFREEHDIEKYAILDKISTQHNAQLYFAQGEENYLGSMKFARGWKYDGEELQEVLEPFTADIIYTKGKRFVLPVGPEDLVVSHPELEKIDDDKWLMYETLREFMTPTYKIDGGNWRDVINKITTNKVVLKPINGMGGNGVFIVDTSDFDFEKYAINEPYLAQDFVDSSRGIPGIVEGVHDLRMVFFNGGLKLSFVRSAKAGTLVSNIGQGGSATILDIATLPSYITDFGYAVDAKFSEYYPRIYTVDCMVQDSKPFVSEINTSPFLPHPIFYGEDYTKKFYTYMVETLIATVEKKKSKN